MVVGVQSCLAKKGSFFCIKLISERVCTQVPFPSVSPQLWLLLVADLVLWEKEPALLCSRVVAVCTLLKGQLAGLNTSTQ